MLCQCVLHLYLKPPLICALMQANVRPEDVKRPKAKAIQYAVAAEGAADDGMEDAEGDGAAAAEGATLDEKYDGHLNHQELTKALLDLSDLYSLAQHLGVSASKHVCRCWAMLLMILR